MQTALDSVTVPTVHPCITRGVDTVSVCPAYQATNAALLAHIKILQSQRQHAQYAQQEHMDRGSHQPAMAVQLVPTVLQAQAHALHVQQIQCLEIMPQTTTHTIYH